MNIEIKSRFDASVLFEGEFGSLKLAVVAAVSSGADLSRASLYGADLSRASLYGAKVTHILKIGPIGSRQAYLVVYFTDQGVKIQAGCFFGTLEEFVAKVTATHGDNEHGKHYRAAIALIEAMTEAAMEKAS